MTSLLLLFLIASTASQRPDEFRCTYSRREVCDKAGCAPIPVGDAYLLIPSSSELRRAWTAITFDEPPVTIRRCDSKGCTPVRVNSEMSGAYLNVWQRGGGYMLKFVDWEAAGEPGEFVEVATLGLATFVSRGKCPWTPSDRG